MKTKISLLICAASLLPIMASGDVLVLKNGKVLEGTVLQRTSNEVLFQLDYGTLRFPNSTIRKITSNPDGKAAGQPSTAFQATNYLPSWSQVIATLAKQRWATELKQIPATVIDNGNLKNVPYMSFQCGHAYEMNIYGDPDHPAGVEIGVTKHLLNDKSAKSNSIEFIASLLSQTSDRQLLRNLNPRKDALVKSGWTYEITPPSDPDAYGGWWVSVYSLNLLDKARASESDLRAITEFVASPPTRYTSAESKPTETSDIASTSWTSNDRSYATSSRSSYSTSSDGGGGTVYVRGYYRKDGTYVRSHTRRAPRR
jgi:hypothetical protein